MRRRSCDFSTRKRMRMLKIRHLRHPVLTARHVAFLLRLHAEAHHRSLEGRRFYKGDARFHLDAVSQGLSDRSEGGRCDRQLLERICVAYRAASYMSRPGVYEPTGWWRMLRTTGLMRVLQALEEGNTSTLQPMYANFFRDSCSDGLVGKNALLIPKLPQALARIHQWASLSEALSRLDRWKTLTCGRYDLNELRTPMIGNPFGIVLDDIFISSGAEHQHYGAQRIADILKKKDAVVAEIGGGYGAMAYYLLRDHPGTTYCNFDLPESLALAAYYLMRCFPEKRVLLYGESSLKDKDIEKYDIVLLPLQELTRMPAHFADMIFSSHAMSDLNSEALKEYLERVKHLTRKYFLYQGMTSSAKSLQQLMVEMHPSFMLSQEKQYYLHGQEGQEFLQSELLYEMSQTQ